MAKQKPPQKKKGTTKGHSSGSQKLTAEAAASPGREQKREKPQPSASTNNLQKMYSLPPRPTAKQQHQISEVQHRPQPSRSSTCDHHTQQPMSNAASKKLVYQPPPTPNNSRSGSVTAPTETDLTKQAQAQERKWKGPSPSNAEISDFYKCHRRCCTSRLYP